MATVTLACVLASRARGAGDGWEYQCMLESWFRHLSPEQRLADADQARAVMAPHAWIGDSRDGFFPTAGGLWFSYHFWFYSLLAVPAKAVLHWLRADEFYALAITNAALFAGTVALALRRASRERVAFVLLAAAGPIAWYVTWPHAEVLEWAFVVASLCAYERRRYALASLCAGVAALQAPPAELLALPAIGAAVLWKRRDVPLAVGGASVALVPAAFYQAMYGRPNLILATGMASSHLASAHRVLTLLFDLDHGMLPYLPATLLLAAAGLVFGRRRAEALVFIAVALAMATLASQTVNFNAGCAGMNRYATWIAPVFAFVGARNLRLGAVWGRGSIAAGVVLQAAIAFTLTGDDDAHAHHALAAAMLRRAPSLYPQDVESFAERTTGRPMDWPFKPLVLPIAMGDSSGPTKLLVDKPTLDDLGRWFEVRSDWLARARAEHEDETGPFYVEPPEGMVRPRLAPRRRGALLTFGEGWYGLEGEDAHKFRWMRRRGELVVRRSVAGSTLRLTGVLPSGLDSPPRMSIKVRGEPIDEFVAPAGTFTRDVALPAGDDEELPMVIESSASVEAGGRSLAYALTRWGPPLTQTSIGGPGVGFLGEWSEPAGVAPDVSRCMRGDASIAIEASRDGEERALLAIAVSPVRAPSAPSTWRVTIDGREVEQGPVFRVARRIWPVGAEAHVVRFVAAPTFDAADRAALCFWALRVAPVSELD